MSDRKDPSRRLSGSEAADVARHVAGLSADSLPLAAGLRAAAAETRSRRTAGSLRQIADNLDRGAPIEQAVRDIALRLPPPLEAAFDAAIASAEFAPVLLDVIDQQHRGRATRWSVVAVLAYPLALLATALVLFVALQLSVVRGFHDVAQEFQLQLPMALEAVFWWSDVGAWLVISALGLLLIVTGLTWLLADRATWYRLLGALPLVGPIWTWTGHAEIAKLAGTLIGRQLPLTKSLALACAAGTNAAAGQRWRSALRQLDSGQALSHALAADYHFPSVMPAYLSFGEQTGQVPESLLAASELLARMAEARSRLARHILPIVVLICVAMTVLATALAMLAPPLVLLGALV